MNGNIRSRDKTGSTHVALMTIDEINEKGGWVMELPDTPVPEKPSFASFEGPSEGWRELSHWLPRGPAAQSYELGSDGTLRSTAHATEPLTFHEPGNAADSGASLTFTSDRLEADRVLMGPATLELRATLSGPDANFYVHLLDVDESGTEAFVNDGYLKASHRESHVTPTPMTPREPFDYRIEVRAQHYRFRVGHSVRLRLWGGPTDSLVQPSSVDVTVETGVRSKLSLPGFAGLE